jgi:hypothetical protein
LRDSSPADIAALGFPEIVEFRKTSAGCAKPSLAAAGQQIEKGSGLKKLCFVVGPCV